MKGSSAYLAEGLGSALLLAVVVGSGIMGERLAQGNAAIALLANSLATGAGLYVLISVLGPISGAHFNPLVTAAMWRERQLGGADALAYIIVQIVGAIAGVILANIMFDMAPIEFSPKARAGTGIWISEIVATSGLLLTILLAIRLRATAMPALVGTYIGAAYWFTASTSFANPAVTLARCLTPTFAGIRPADAPAFILAQCVGAIVGVALTYVLLLPVRTAQSVLTTSNDIATESTRSAAESAPPRDTEFQAR